MSAYLDRSQGVTFVFSNIYQLYKKAKAADPESPIAIERKIIKERQAKLASVEKFTPPELKAKEGQRHFPVPMGVREAEAKALKENTKSMKEIKKNLSELTDAHEKLRFLLQELEALTKK
jgi:hypothetical protein